jgi:hypothetical protein
LAGEEIGPERQESDEQCKGFEKQRATIHESSF